MKKTKTQELVYGAMLLALYATYLILDRYLAGGLYMLIYYFIPLPFVVYGLKFSTRLFPALLVGALVLGFICGMPETAFFGLTGILASYVITLSITKKWDGTQTMVLLMASTILSQILSITLFASLFGYNFQEDLAWVSQYISLPSQVLKIFPSFFCIVMGALEAYLYVTLTDLVLLRLKMERVPKFSILKVRFPKIIGILFMVSLIAMRFVNSEIILMAYLVLWLMIMVQGVSFLFLVNVVKIKKPLLNIVFFLSCFIPFLNYLTTLAGLFDIFSEMREKLLYNSFNNGVR